MHVQFESSLVCIVYVVGLSCRRQRDTITMRLRYFQIIVGFIISLIDNCHSMSKTVFQLALYTIQDQSEIIFISDSFPDTIPDRFRHMFQLSFIKFNSKYSVLEERFYSKLTRNYSQSVKIIVALPAIPETLSVVAQIGKSQGLKQNPSQSSLVVLWPKVVVDELEANKTIEANFKSINISQDFVINRELLVAFSVTGGTRTKRSVGILKNYLFYEVYTLNAEVIFKHVEMVGIGLRCPNCTSQTARRKNLKGLLLRFEGVQDQEYNDDTLFVEKNGTRIVEFDKSFSVNIVELLRISLNFTVKPVRSYQWGQLLPNGTTLGVIQDVFDGLADVGITTTAMLPYRAKIVSYLPATDEYVIAAFFRPPSLNAIRDIFMQPFEPNLWAAVLATWITLACSMILFTFIRKKVGAHNNNKDPNATEPDFTQDSMIWALATACQQGWDEHPSALSLRAIFISGSFTAVIAYAGYSAAIVSTLSVRVDPIQSPAQLIQSNLRVGMRDGFFRDIIPEQLEEINGVRVKRDIISDLYRTLSSRESERFVNMTYGISLLKKYPYAFIGLKEAFYDLLKVTPSPNVDVDICGIKELRILKQGYKAGMFTHKMFAYREFFRLILILIRERGILWRLRTEFTYTRRCLESSDNAGRALGANDVFTAFMILCGGYVLSTTFLMIEKLIYLYKYNYMFVVTP